MSQEFNNRSQGQRIRRAKENIEATAEAIESLAQNQGKMVAEQSRQSEQIAQLDRDMRMTKARLTALERDRARR